MKALLPVAAVVFLIALPPALWPGAFAYLLLWVLLRRWRGELAWGAPLFALYLFWGLRLEPASFPDLVARFAVAGRLASGLLSWSFAASLAANGSRWAPLPLFLWAFALRPDAVVLGLGLVAWVYWNLVRSSQRALERGVRFQISPRALLATSLILLFIAGALVASGWRPAPPGRAGAEVVSAPAPVSQVANPPGAGEGGHVTGAGANAGKKVRPARLPPWVNALSDYATVLSAIVALLLIMVLTRLLWLIFKVPGQRAGNAYRALLLGILVLSGAFFWVLWYQLLFRGEGTGGGDAAAFPATQATGGAGASALHDTVPRVLDWAGWTVGGSLVLGVLFLLVVLVGLGYLLWRLSHAGAVAPLAQGGEVRTDRRSAHHAGRVRAAYRAFLLLMRGELPKRTSETPQEYAARIALRRPRLAVAVRELTGLYEPVRYGGLADDAEAARAEASLRHIQAEIEKSGEEEEQP